MFEREKEFNGITHVYRNGFYQKKDDVIQYARKNPNKKDAWQDINIIVNTVNKLINNDGNSYSK